MFERGIKMSQSNVYNLCCRYHGQTVRITCSDGRVHVGEITRINRHTVWIRPTGGLCGYGYGYYGRNRGFGYGVALGAITGIILATAFFW